MIRGLGAMAYERLGWFNALVSLGHDVFIYDPTTIATFDIFNLMEPDVYIGTAWELDRAVHKCIKARPELKSLFIAGDWGPLTDTIDLEIYPILTANQQQKDAISKLKEETGQPEGVFVHYHQNWVDATMSGWETLGIHAFGLPHATDIRDYAVGQIVGRYKCDVGFVGGYWDYKGGPLRKYMWEVCKEEYGLQVKIYGNVRWSVSQYCGSIHQNNMKHLYRTAVVSPNIFEPHSLKYGFDMNQRVFQTISSGGLCISEDVKSLYQDFFGSNIVPIFKNVEEFLGTIEHFKKNPDDRLRYIQRGLEEVYKNHTYHHRVAVMFEKMGFEDEAKIAHSSTEHNFNRIMHNLPEELKCQDMVATG